MFIATSVFEILFFYENLDRKLLFFDFYADFNLASYAVLVIKKPQRIEAF